jgi:MoaA/NifB/PqqE/SkfB family radical SAM enzyme
MTSTIQPGRINLTNRTKLETVIPLSTPYLVFIDPSDICNAKCGWCPTGSGAAGKYKKPQLMEFGLYKKIVDDLADMPEMVKVLRLYMMGEPLLNPDLPKMVGYAKESGRFGQIDLTSNGIALTPKLGNKLTIAGLDKIFISVPSDYGDEYLDRIRNFYTHAKHREVHVKIIGDGMDNLRKELFYVDFEDCSDSMFIENLSPCWPEFDVGEVGEVGIYGQSIGKGVDICPYIFYSLAINSDGTVSLCFLDWKRGMVIGDLKVESFKDIWNGTKLHSYRLANLKGNRNRLDFCKECRQLVYGNPDNIDGSADDILRRL